MARIFPCHLEIQALFAEKRHNFADISFGSSSTSLDSLNIRVSLGISRSIGVKGTGSHIGSTRGIFFDNEQSSHPLSVQRITHCKTRQVLYYEIWLFASTSSMNFFISTSVYLSLGSIKMSGLLIKSREKISL